MRSKNAPIYSVVSGVVLLFVLFVWRLELVEFVVLKAFVRVAQQMMTVTVMKIGFIAFSFEKDTNEKKNMVKNMSTQMNVHVK